MHNYLPIFNLIYLFKYHESYNLNITNPIKVFLVKTKQWKTILSSLSTSIFFQRIHGGTISIRLTHVQLVR